jgi:hypothetical protein
MCTQEKKFISICKASGYSLLSMQICSRERYLWHDLISSPPPLCSAACNERIMLHDITLFEERERAHLLLLLLPENMCEIGESLGCDLRSLEEMHVGEDEKNCEMCQNTQITLRVDKSGVRACACWLKGVNGFYFCQVADDGIV